MSSNTIHAQVVSRCQCWCFLFLGGGAVGPLDMGDAMCQTVCIKDAPAKVSASLNDHRNNLCPVPQPSHETHDRAERLVERSGIED